MIFDSRVTLLASMSKYVHESGNNAGGAFYSSDSHSTASTSLMHSSAPGCTHVYTCSLKPYNIKGKTVTTNVVDGTGVPLSVMIRQTISGLEGQCCLSGSCSTVVGSCSTAWEVVALLGKL